MQAYKLKFRLRPFISCFYYVETSHAHTRPLKLTAEAGVEYKQEVSSLNLNLSLQAWKWERRRAPSSLLSRKQGAKLPPPREDHLLQISRLSAEFGEQLIVLYIRIYKHWVHLLRKNCCSVAAKSFSITASFRLLFPKKNHVFLSKTTIFSIAKGWRIGKTFPW